jgi:hypothetical protein
MSEMPDGWCAPPFYFQPENEHGDPGPLVVDETFVFTEEDMRHVRMLRAVDRLIWATNAARQANSLPLRVEVN